MSVEQNMDRGRAGSEDARALQLRLYREVGLAAVAEALADTGVSAEVVMLAPGERHTPAMLVRDEKAA